MTNCKHTLWFAPVLLLVSVIVIFGVASPNLAYASEISLSDENKIKVRKKEEQSLKRQDKSYSQQAKALAKHYKKTAKLIKKQGGDPKPLLDAAAYFEDQSKI